jgi:hypothetical protein
MGKNKSMDDVPGSAPGVGDGTVEEKVAAATKTGKKTKRRYIPIMGKKNLIHHRNRCANIR